MKDKKKFYSKRYRGGAEYSYIYSPNGDYICTVYDSYSEVKRVLRILNKYLKGK